MSRSAVESIIKFNSQSVGRDRLFRLFQYGSRLIWWLMEKYSHDKDVINKLKNLEFSLSSARKLFRLGRSLDALYGALSTISLQDLTLRLTLTLSRINFALYLLTDHMLWLGQVGLAEINKSKWSKLSCKLWLYSLFMNLVRDIYEVINIFKFNRTVPLTFGQSLTNRGQPVCKPPTKYNALLQWLIDNRDVTLDTIKNGCDFWIPFSSLGYVKLSPGAIGILGVISSVVGIYTIIDPSSKLLPI